MPRVRRSTRGEGHERRYFYGAVWAVTSAQPLLWVLARRMEAAAEEVCDDYEVQYGGDRQQYAHRLVDIVTTEEKGAQNTANAVGGRALAGPVDLIEDRRLAMQGIGVVLRVVANVDLIADFGRALAGLQFASDDLEQGRLAGAVRTNDADFLAALYREIDSLEDFDIAVALAECFDPNHFVDGSFHRRKVKAHDLAVLIALEEGAGKTRLPAEFERNAQGLAFHALPDPDGETRGGLHFGGGVEYFTGSDSSIKAEGRWDVVSHPSGTPDATGLTLTLGYKVYF